MKIRIAAVLLLLAFQMAVALGQPKWNSIYQAYIDRYKDIAIEQMLTHGVPASITLAQGLLESNAGRSELTTKGNNHFGIKCHDWTGPSMQKDDDARNECFRVYENARESFEDHSKFLKRPRYKTLFTLSVKDYKGWAKGLKACGYATNPSYAQHLVNIIELYHLDQYDRAKTYDSYLAAHSGASGFAGANEHRIYMNNKNYYVKARKGDTFRSIAKELDTSYRKLARYNERNKRDVLGEGDIVYLKKKRSSADKRFKKIPHTVRSGESMYDIAQIYGIRLKNLYKKNKLAPDYVPRVGDKLRVY